MTRCGAGLVVVDGSHPVEPGCRRHAGSEIIETLLRISGDYIVRPMVARFRPLIFPHLLIHSICHLLLVLALALDKLWTPGLSVRSLISLLYSLHL